MHHIVSYFWLVYLNQLYFICLEKMYRQEERKQEEMQANLRDRLIREVIWRQTQLHLRQYERLQKIVNPIPKQQSQEEEMHKSIIEVGESSNGTREVSCKCLYQSSKIGVNGIGGNEEDNGANNNDGTNAESVSLEA
ncbi:uncharacterized protein LOC9310730 isoform X1 [Arabidopsis lyrata subsp. lyrata]|uniref:uncharacterized protein LOC9310730 isoform X1 n=1 Tax=Arabidopsis lyrata subsp. lyrata TaxID=81972 RepID=UPI000A29D466|nr:uncharacterized protein LOC9310730 isoform X1 [Arabidopsis lyrata subsp. lyrata]|eukprot:XP_020876272.1 uncharacterized protein LOC9310730 isoform X1 [Arabidopsis lyrata subsp. lyrata]